MHGRGIWGAAAMTSRVRRQCSRLEGGLELVQAVMVALMGGGGGSGQETEKNQDDEGHSPTERSGERK